MMMTLSSPFFYGVTEPLLASRNSSFDFGPSKNRYANDKLRSIFQATSSLIFCAGPHLFFGVKFFFDAIYYLYGKFWFSSNVYHLHLLFERSAHNFQYLTNPFFFGNWKTNKR